MQTCHTFEIHSYSSTLSCKIAKIINNEAFFHLGKTLQLKKQLITEVFMLALNNIKGNIIEPEAQTLVARIPQVRNQSKNVIMNVYHQQQ